MSLLQTLAGGGVSAKTYVDDVFSVWTYTGNGSTQTITNGIDLAGKGGLVWGKHRNGSTGHILTDTVQGYNSQLTTNTTNAANNATTLVTSFTSTGFTLGSGASLNGSGDTYVSWTFRKAPKFFDVQTATLASGNATVSFTDLATLGMVIVKRTDSTGSWYVWHRSLTAGKLLYLEQTAAEATLGHITVSGTTLTLVDGVLADGDYVCYGFAHDASADGIIQCGSFVSDGSSAFSVNLGWEPQFVLHKVAIGASNQDWKITDTARGMTATDAQQEILRANTSGAASVGQDIPKISATGFYNTTGGTTASATHIYLAIRRPNKPPTSGTQVFEVLSTNKAQTTQNVAGTLPPDLAIFHPMLGNTGNHHFYDRLRGSDLPLYSNLTNAESGLVGTLAVFGAIQNGIRWGDFSPYWNGNAHIFRRAPGVFDQVCYTGTGVAHTEAHNLGVVPELMIVKSRSLGTQEWAVQVLGDGTKLIKLNSTAAITTNSAYWNDVAPTTSVFTVGASGMVNSSGATYVAYLFATKAGISKVGSYTGNGSNQTINCGFTTGARFILIKRTDFTGDWFVWDSVRGIVAGNDPHLSLNTTAAEVTTDDSIDPDTSGFIVNQDAATNINVNAATYIYLSLA